MLQGIHLNKSFGGLKAVDDVSFDIGEASITGLVGPNGSGKTTLFHLITGFYRLDSGKIFFQGKAIHHLTPYKISRLGIVRTFQHSRILPYLSVIDNLIAAVPDQTGEKILPNFLRPKKVKIEERKNKIAAEDILETLNLSHLVNAPAYNLSYGQRKLLEIGRVLMSHPKMILLDEPTAGVNPTLIKDIIRIILKLKERGIKFLLVEHNMPLMIELCEKLFVMDSGRIIFSGAPEDARKNKAVIDAYLGRQENDVT